MPDFFLERRERDREGDEESSEDFDRFAFAEKALALVRPHETMVLLGRTKGRLHVEVGRHWGRGNARWAVLLLPPRASRRAIAIAVASLAREPGKAYSLDVLLEGLA